jgi:hypothetical protein
MRTMVLLRHDMPGGESHFDWLIDPGAGRGLITYRVTQRIDGGGLTGLEGVRIGDHRRRYLDYEGPISGGRGSVVRLAGGSIRVLAEQDDRLGIVGDLGSWSGALVGHRREGDAWHFDRFE